MLRLRSEVTIKGDQTWVFDALSSCTIVEDTESLTDTCVITLPKKIRWQGVPKQENDALNYIPPIKRGDHIMVRLGYTPPGMPPSDSDLKARFVGYVRRVDAKAPIKIECEDGMFLLKVAPTKQIGFPNPKLKELIGFLLKGRNIAYQVIGDDIELGRYRITRPTVAQELNELKRERGFRAYFRQMPDKADPRKTKSVLYVGYDYPFDIKKKESFIHSKNIINEELEFRRAEDIKLKVKATSVDRKNRRLEVNMGDKDGEEIQVFANNIGYDALKLFAEKALDRYKYTGYQGSIETFGEPVVHKCEGVHLEISDGNQGDYLIKKVEVNFGTSGYRQKIELGPPLKVEKK
ncbi:MAG: hypothetical protein E6Q66_01170 [Pedobacter sp.]|nr:MAG: hypothetical protein E6Q66_01170 [Pedobacter sp.]